VDCGLIKVKDGRLFLQNEQFDMFSGLEGV
jgi:hypothetical protein